jgi:hypothetical protein
VICCVVLFAVLVMGCRHEEPPGETTVSRIIVKFTDSMQPPPKMLSTKWTGAAVSLRHERAMSGESHLYTGRLSKAALRRIVRVLNERPGVDYAQADRKLKLQRPSD